MKDNDLLNEHRNDSIEDFHFGKMIETVARRKNISPKQLGETIYRYQYNPVKIFKLDDMDAEDVVKISYLLEYHFLDEFSKKYLSHLPRIKSKCSSEKYAITFNIKTRSYDLHGNTGKCDFLKNINFGLYIKELAKQKGWKEKKMGELLNCSQSTVSDLYGRKSIKVKKMVQISNVFQLNLIAELYLSQMMIDTPFKIFDQCRLSIIGNTIFLEKLGDKNISLQFRPKDEKE